MKITIKNLFIILLAAASLGFSPERTQAATDLNGHWAKDMIEHSISQGYIAGYADGTFRPDVPVGRAEFIALANKYMGFSSSGQISFTDVKPDDWFYGAIATAINEGYASGYPDGSFKPYNPITRETAAVMASNMLHLSPNTEYASYFTDADLISWSKGAIGAAVKAKLLTGYSDGTFRPSNTLTRAEAVALISRVSGKKYDSSVETAYGYNNYYSTANNYDSPYIYSDRQNYQPSDISTKTSPDSDGYYRIYNPDYGKESSQEHFYGSVMYDPRYAGVVKNIYVSGDFALTANINADSELTLYDVTIRGKLVIYSIGKVTLKNCDISQIEFHTQKSNAQIIAASGTVVHDSYIFNSVTLIQETTSERGFRNVYTDEGFRERDALTVEGDFSYISVNGRRGNLVINRGTTATVEIGSKGENCNVEIKKGAIVSFMDVRASCHVHGSGEITLAKIAVDNAEFEIIPKNLSGTKDPVYVGSALGLINY